MSVPLVIILVSKCVWTLTEGSDVSAGQGLNWATLLIVEVSGIIFRKISAQYVSQMHKHVYAHTCALNKHILVQTLDIDECSRRLHDCEQMCINTKGGFNCSCNEGFLLQDDMRSCQGKLSFWVMTFLAMQASINLSSFSFSVDPNRNCSADNVCEQLCVRVTNTSTGVTAEVCSCRNGYTLDENKRNCSGI